MKKCKEFQKNLVASLSGELKKDEEKLLLSHLETCASCRKELDELKRLLQGSDSFQEEIDTALASVDWNALPDQISEYVFKEEQRQRAKSWLTGIISWLSQPKLRPVFAGILFGLLLGSVATYLILKPPHLELANGETYFASKDFLERVELEMARRETLDYLEKSQYLLLDFVQSPSREKVSNESIFASQQAKNLLSKKKYLNPELDKFQMAKAKEICDQIEILFLELSQISTQLSKEEIKRIQNLIQEKQLLLKIKLVKKELEGSEV
jgi:hypothetical protein